ncbi:MAG: pyridoxamine 5'-phosphate oxidase family protein [Ignavibacteriales bacterium]|nr:MAG: pyridoxamine 5'-phosphate oxidase family protein [Ignavibacteriales bacterium]
MQKQITQIRDLEIIEKELNSNSAGLLAVLNDEDQIIQLPTNYLYMDKNIYVFFNDEEEIFNSIKFDHLVSFGIIRPGENRKTSKAKNSPIYHFVSITITGVLRKVDDVKLIDDLKKNYIKKFSDSSTQQEIEFSGTERIVIIDTEEIQAVEEIGG